MRVLLRGLASATVLFWVVTALPAVTLGQIDDFQSGSVMGWVEGIVSPNPPTNQPSGGPAGVGDRYLRNVSSGGLGAGGKLVMFNQVQWTGNYIAEGVSRIEIQMANFGTTTLNMRVAIEGAFTRYASTTPFVLRGDGVWRSAVFDLTASGLTFVDGVASLNEVLADVVTLRILSAIAGPSWNGDTIAATLGVDNIRAAGDAPATPPPVPDGVFGAPMRASRSDPTGSTILLTWDVTTCQATGYHALFGNLATVASLTIGGGVCSLGTSGSFSWTTVPSGDLWFVVVSDNGATVEGSWGTNSSGAERGGSTPSGTCGIVTRNNSGTCP